MPAGHSSPVLTTSQIFLTAYEGDRLLVLAFDRKTGTGTVAAGGATASRRAISTARTRRHRRRR